MTFCFISGFSQSSQILRSLGDSINIEAEKLYFSASELADNSSYVENLHKILNHKQNIVLIGWSLGATIALEYASTYPVEALVLISGTACFPKMYNNPIGIEIAKIEALIKGVKETKEHSLKRFISNVCSPFSNQQEFDAYYKYALNVETDKLIDNLIYYQRDFRACCENILCDTLVIHDINDRVVPISHGEALSQAINNAKKHITKGFGHLVVSRNSNVLAVEIEKLIKRKINEKY